MSGVRCPLSELISTSGNWLLFFAESLSRGGAETLPLCLFAFLSYQSINFSLDDFRIVFKPELEGFCELSNSVNSDSDRSNAVVHSQFIS
jgi:hypothetical protein